MVVHHAFGSRLRPLATWLLVAGVIGSASLFSGCNAGLADVTLECPAVDDAGLESLLLVSARSTMSAEVEDPCLGIAFYWTAGGSTLPVDDGSAIDGTRCSSTIGVRPQTVGDFEITVRAVLTLEDGTETERSASCTYAIGDDVDGGPLEPEDDGGPLEPEDAGDADGGPIEPEDAGVDAGRVDAGPVDAGQVDAGVDGGLVDAGPDDAGVDAGVDAGIDAGPFDAGGDVDAGLPDAGPPDAGPVDAGPVDAGPAPDDECALGIDNCGDGVCTDIPGEGYTCTCAPGYMSDEATLPSCLDVDECASPSACGGVTAGVCTNLVGSFQCACNDGYVFNGATCADVNECNTPDICGAAAAGTCENTPGGYTCDCEVGFRFNGTTCVVDVACDGNPCGTGICRGTNETDYTCECPAGTFDDGTTCADVDECAATPDLCGGLGVGTCTNAIGSYSCVCDAGYEDNGTTCVNIDECSQNANICGGAGVGTCVDATPGYSCDCEVGFVENGGTCEPI